MLNIFRNTNKHQDINNEASLLIKQFNGLNIQLYGTYEEPLFKAKDIGNLLEMSNIREVIKNFNSKQKGVSLTDTPGGKQEVVFLTAQGLYKILMISRKPVAKLFQKWVFNVIKEIRLKGKYDLEEKIKEQLEQKELQLQAKEQELLRCNSNLI